jgi:hypothetical protein
VFIVINQLYRLFELLAGEFSKVHCPVDMSPKKAPKSLSLDAPGVESCPEIMPFTYRILNPWWYIPHSHNRLVV